MIYKSSNYRLILQDELTRRIKTNPKYSLRAMAKHIDVAPSLLSDVIRGKKNLSPDSALKVARSLNYDEKMRNYFIALVRVENAKSAELKSTLIDEIKNQYSEYKPTDLTLDVFKIISDWHHIAILELTDIDNFETTPNNIAKILGINVIEAQSAIDRLIRCELIEVTNGKLVRTHDNLLAKSEKPNQALRNFHKQMLEKAINSLTEQDNTEKFVGSETFAFSSTDLKKAEQIIENCFEQLVQLSNKQNQKDSVYHLGIQFFKLTKNINELKTSTSKKVSRLENSEKEN